MEYFAYLGAIKEAGSAACRSAVSTFLDIFIERDLKEDAGRNHYAELWDGLSKLGVRFLRTNMTLFGGVWATSAWAAST